MRRLPQTGPEADAIAIKQGSKNRFSDVGCCVEHEVFLALVSKKFDCIVFDYDSRAARRYSGPAGGPARIVVKVRKHYSALFPLSNTSPAGPACPTNPPPSDADAGTHQQ